LQQGFRGVVFRNVNGPTLVECVHRVAAGETWIPPQLMRSESAEDDMVGTRVRDRLTPKEMRIVALIVQGCKNREIAIRLKTTEQVIKNYLRSVYDKTGVSDRLELALFTIHHRVLAQAAAEMGSRLEVEEQTAPPAVARKQGSGARGQGSVLLNWAGEATLFNFSGRLRLGNRRRGEQPWSSFDRLLCQSTRRR
jgi:DNA-binding CsgD family transcriptional regulator